MRIFWLSVCALCSYLIGNINPAYIISRMKKFDIREAGSGNAGGSNALITMGKAIGAGCMLFDIFKAFAAVKISSLLLPNEPLAVATASASVILGHMYPVFMGFKGGKGLACLGGSILAYNFGFAMILLGIELVLVFIIDYICVVPLTASVTYPVAYFLWGGPMSGTLILGVAAVAMILKHRQNLENIRLGKEVHFSFLWNREAETNRIKANMTEEEYDGLQIKKNS